MTWQEDYRRTVLDTMSKMGCPVDPSAIEKRNDWGGQRYSVYGGPRSGVSYDDRKTLFKHFTEDGCTPDYDKCGDVVEVRWSEFEDTMSDNSDHHGLETTMTCVCGKYTNQMVCWEGATSDVIQAVLREALKRPDPA